MFDNQKIAAWDNCLIIIKDIVSPSSFRTWFEPIRAINLEGTTLTLEVPSEFFREYLEEHYLNLLSATLKREIGANAKLIYKVNILKDESITYNGSTHKNLSEQSINFPKSNIASSTGTYAIPGLKKMTIDPNLNNNLTFDKFIEGSCNKLGRSAGLEIAKNPGKTAFNPFFVYGGPGLGKTHLAQAIGLEIKEKSPEKIVLYVTANQFQTQYMDAVMVKNKLTDFLHFYQSIDVLILDDVHEFADKNGTQNAYFQIFNHLQQLGKQIVLTSDRAPVELKGLELRLLSRFKWGLTCELQAPNYETRYNILKNKSQEAGRVLEDDICEYIATKVQSNVRELEGTLNSLFANATLLKKPITKELAQELIDHIASKPKEDISIKSIKKTVCQYFGLSSDQLVSQTRKRDIAQARQIAMYLSRNLTNNSLASIGSQLGNRNHATVLYACTTVCDLKDTDNTFNQYIIDIEKELKK